MAGGIPPPTGELGARAARRGSLGEGHALAGCGCCGHEGIVETGGTATETCGPRFTLRPMAMAIAYISIPPAAGVPAGAAEYPG